MVDRIDIDITVYRLYTAGDLDIREPYFDDSVSCTDDYDCIINEGLPNLHQGYSYGLESIHIVTNHGEQSVGDAWTCCVRVD